MTTERIGPAERWERYEAAATGIKEYWFPAMPSRSLRSKPVRRELVGEAVVLIRHNGRAYALEDRCPHRFVPLSMGRCEFAGHITCVYHGWTFDVTTGRLVAALPDGPDSPVVGKAGVKTYPVEERCGLVWVWLGRGAPVAVEDDIPEELLRRDARVYAFFREAKGNWLHAAENGFDEAHGKMLHRSSWWVFFKRFAGWNITEIVRTPDGKWLSRFQHEVHSDDHYPGLGRWPRFNFFQRRRKKIAQGSNEHSVCIRLPGILRVAQPGRARWTHYEWYTPIDRDRYQYLVLAVAWTSGIGRLTWWLRYWTYILWVHHYDFNNQDLTVVPWMGGSHPVRAFRPDVSITAWRKMVEEETRSPTSRPRIQAAE
jgi:phenylpropionate dioxygenase-like ring-hydroxylating dioxygenase large terminal subunit